VATVSRVLNDYPDVSPKTRRRVQEAIRTEGFVPDRTARSLVTGRSRLIAVVLETGVGHPDLQHPFFQEVLVGLKRVAGPSAYDLLLFSAGDVGGGSGGHGYLGRIRHHRVQGVVLMGVARDDPQIEEVARSGVPCMAVDLDLAGGRTGSVMSDNLGGAALAVRHLHALGHRRIAHIGGPTATMPGAHRLMGFADEIRRLGLPHRPEYVRRGDFYPDSGHRAMAELLDLQEPPTAVFVSADLMAAGAIQALADRGLRAPDHVAVVGFDDIHIAPLLQPALTTIRQDMPGLGEAAARALVEMIADPAADAPAITLPVQLIVRESSGGRKKGRPAEGRRPLDRV
jgi:LacI family transcriptional regulator